VCITESFVPREVVKALSRLAVSVLFSWYTANFGSDNKTCGSMDAVIGWLRNLEALLFPNQVPDQTARHTTPTRAAEARGAGKASGKL
jgi:membrane protein